MWQGGITNSRHKLLPVLWGKTTRIKRDAKGMLPYVSWDRQGRSTSAQPFNPASPYFNVMTNAEQKDK